MRLTHFTTLIAAGLAACLAASAQAADTNTANAADIKPFIGHYSGTLVAKSGEGSAAELSLDDYQCYALSIKEEQGIETGFYEVAGGRVLLKSPSGDVRHTFRVDGTSPATLTQLNDKVAPAEPMQETLPDCCRVVKD